MIARALERYNKDEEEEEEEEEEEDRGAGGGGAGEEGKDEQMAAERGHLWENTQRVHVGRAEAVVSHAGAARSVIQN